jgi:hypothetical protein
VINLRTLKPLDRDTIVASIKKTHRLVSTEEGWPQCGIGAELIAIANEECFDDLDAPPERVTGAEVPMPYAANLEAAALPQVLFPPSVPDQEVQMLRRLPSCRCRSLFLLHVRPASAWLYHCVTLGLRTNSTC